MLPTSMPLRRMTGCAAGRAGVALLGVGDVGDDVGREVAPDVDVAVVEALAVGARRRGSASAATRSSTTTTVSVRADRRAVAGLHPGRLDLLDLWPGRMPPTALTALTELRLVDLVVAADDGGDEPAVAGHEEGGLGRPLRRRSRGTRRASRSSSCPGVATSSSGSGVLGRGRRACGMTATWRLAA